MNKARKRDYIALILNFIIIILELIGFYIVTSYFGLGIFEYYTQDSNLLLLISSILFMVFTILKLKGNLKKLPYIVQILKYMATVSVTVTFIVAVTILSWTMPGGLKSMLFSGSMLYHHTLCPILAIISFVMFEKYDIESKKDAIRSLYFTFAYALVLIPLNILKIVEGPYPFLMVYKQPVWMSILWVIIIIGGTFGIATILKIGNKKKKK